MGEMDAMAGGAGGDLSPASDPVEVRYHVNYSHSGLCCVVE